MATTLRACRVRAPRFRSRPCSIRTSDANQVGLYSELDAILAVIIGGTLLGMGGRFSLLASVVGALVIQATTTSTLAIGVPASAIIAVKALVVIEVILL